MLIIHIAYITWLVTTDAWHATDVIGVYKIHLRAGAISYFAELAILRMAGYGRGRVPQHLTELAIVWLASTAMGEVGAHNPGGYPPGQKAKTIEYILY